MQTPPTALLNVGYVCVYADVPFLSLLDLTSRTGDPLCSLCEDAVLSQKTTTIDGLAVPVCMCNQCMCVCVYVCICVCFSPKTSAIDGLAVPVCMCNLWMDGCMYVCMYVCIYV
jgi:hypothetical protein